MCLRSPIFLKSGLKVPLIDLRTHNCEVINAHVKYAKKMDNPKLGVMFNPPKNYKRKNINFLLNMWNLFPIFNSKSEIIFEPLPNTGPQNIYINFAI